MKEYMNTNLSPARRAELLLAELGPEEKLSQLICFMPIQKGACDELRQKYPQGAGHISCLQMRGLKTLEEGAEFQREIQDIVMAESEHHIPAIFHMEGLCGAYIQEAASFPSGIGRASSWDPELEERVGGIVGRQERAIGVSETLAPVLDISRDARMGRQGETYGEDPTLAAAMGTAYVKGLQGQDEGGMRSEGVAKHFLGFHASIGGIHGTECDISERQLREVYAKPFQAAITEGGLRGVMPCYNTINGQPVSASGEILTGLLREEMGFDGIVVSDYGAIQNIHTVQRAAESLTEAGRIAMEAGMDVELQMQCCYNEELLRQFVEGSADMRVLDRAVRRVLEAKFRMGLFEHPYALSGQALKAAFSCQEDRETALEAAKESLVLLKNNGVLPIAKDVKKIAVIGCHAADPKIYYGGYTHFSMEEGEMAAISTMAGLDATRNGKAVEMETIPGTPIQADQEVFWEVLRRQNPGVKSMVDALREKLPDVQIDWAYGYPFAGNDLSYHEEALALAQGADLVIVTLGGKHGTSSIASMGEGIDAADINLPVCQEVFLEKLAALDKPSAAVHFNGRAISSNAADRYLGAILEAWNPAEGAAEAIASALTGEYNPGGKLPVTVARHTGQIPIYYNHKNNSSWHQQGSIAFPDYVDCPHAPRYFFGHGLSYTTFAYSDVALEKKELTPGQPLTVSVTVENTGTCAGDEVVQLYIRDLYASMSRPVLELAGFKRIRLAPGEKQRLTFLVKPGQLAFLDRAMRWKVEAGEYEVSVGSSSVDLRSTETFFVTADAYVDGKTRGFYADVWQS